MSRLRLVLLSVAGLVVLLVAAGALIGWQALKVNDALQRAVEDATALRDSLQGEDEARIDADLAALQDSATEAQDRTGGWVWAMAGAVPFIGDDAQGVEVAADVIADLSNDGLEPLARTATELDGLLPEDGGIDLKAVEALQGPVEQAASALAEAEQRLASEDSSGYIERFRDKFRELQSQVGDAADATDSASIAVDVMPELLGQEEQKNFLMVFENNAEIRATGGLPGALTILNTDRGQIELGRQVAASSFGERQEPVLPLTKQEEDVFGEQLGTYVLDANFTADFPRAADLIRARYEEVYPERLDGVMSIDTVAISYLLEATGPVTVGGYEITSENAVDVLLHQVYLDIADPSAQDVFFGQVAKAVFDRVSNGEVGRPRDLLLALTKAVDEGRTHVRLFDEELQQQIGDRRVAGATTDADGATDAINVSLLDGTGAKMSYFLRYDVRGMAAGCVDGRERIQVRATLRSEAPKDAAQLPPYVTGGGDFGVDVGKQLVSVQLFTPSGGTVEKFEINGEDYNVKDRALGDRFVSTAFVLVQPGKSADVSWEITDPAGETRTPLIVTPGVEPGTQSSTVAAGC